MPAVAVTDTNNLFGALEFSLAAVPEGVQPIIGCQVHVTAEKLQDDVGALAGGIECNPEAIRVIGQICGKRLFAFGHNL